MPSWHWKLTSRLSRRHASPLSMQSYVARTLGIRCARAIAVPARAHAALIFWYVCARTRHAAVGGLSQRRLLMELHSDGRRASPSHFACNSDARRRDQTGLKKVKLEVLRQVVHVSHHDLNTPPSTRACFAENEKARTRCRGTSGDGATRKGEGKGEGGEGGEGRGRPPSFSSELDSSPVPCPSASEYLSRL